MAIQRSEFIFRVILNILMNFLILAGNAIVLLAFYRFKSLRSIPHLFILNLAITDFLLGLFVMPFVTAAIIAHGWEFGQFMCDLQGALTAIMSVASVFTLTFVSLERKLAICNPFYHHVWFNARKVAYVIALIWLICSILSAMGFLSSKYVFKRVYMLCMIDWNETLWITVFAVVIHFFLPFLLLVYSNVSIIRVLKQRRRVMSSSTRQKTETRRMNRGKKAWRLLLAVVLVFLLCWAPYYLSVACSTLFGDVCSVPERFGFYSVFCAGANSCINPVIYAVMNNSFRKAFFKLLHIKVTASVGKQNEVKPERRTIRSKTLTL